MPLPNKPLDLSQAQVRVPREHRIYATDGGGAFPIHGAIKNADGIWFQKSWTEYGRTNFAFESANDLVAVGVA